MIYLDYAATTPVDDRVLDTYNKVCKQYVGNANSSHKLGMDSKHLIMKATEQISNILNIHKDEIIYTSGATESNNLALKGVCSFYKNRGNHIITTKIEHPSIKETTKYLIDNGYEVSYVNLLDNGLVDLEHLQQLIKDDTILVSICYVDSEVGLRQPIEEIGQILNNYKKVIFHVDATQAIGKVKVNFDNIDLVSFSAHKFYGLTGIGCLIKKKNIELEPLFHGGKSINKYRSGTPSVPLIVSTAKALRLSAEDIEKRFYHVVDLNKKIKKYFSDFKNIIVNSNTECIPHILNISIIGIKPETFIRALEDKGIYLSTKSACSDMKQVSETLINLNKTNSIASSSLRISLSYLTTNEEIDQFLTTFKIIYNELNFKVKE